MTRTLVTEGCYTGTCLKSKVQIGYDHFKIFKTDEGFLIEGRHTLFGDNQRVQNSRFTFDRHWIPNRLEVYVSGTHVTVDFEETKTILVTALPHQEARKSEIPVARHRAYFLLNGALYFPLLLVRRFEFGDPEPQYFDTIPPGLCKVSRMEDVIEGGKRLHRLEMKLELAGGNGDVVEIWVNENLDIIRYQTRQLQLLVALEE